MKNRKWQRVLSWILTLTMLFGTFEGTGFRAFAAEDEVAAEETADDEATAVEEEADSEDTDVNDDAEASDEEEADDEVEAEEVEDAEEADEAEEAVEAEEEEAEEADVTEDAPEEEEDPEAEGAAYIDKVRTVDAVAPVNDWGTWKYTPDGATAANADTATATLYTDGSAIVDIDFGAYAGTNEVTANVAWELTVAGEQVTATDTAYTWNGIALNKTSGVLSGKPLAATEANKTVTITAIEDGSTVDNPTFVITLTAAEESKDLAIVSLTGKDDPEVGSDNGGMWTPVGAENATADLVMALGTGAIGGDGIVFKTTRGVREDIFTGITWSLNEINEDGTVGDEVFQVVPGTPGNLNGLTFTRNEDGTLTIAGEPTKVLTAEGVAASYAEGNFGPAGYYLVATNVGSGQMTDAQRVAKYPIDFKLTALRPSLQYQIDKTDAAMVTVIGATADGDNTINGAAANLNINFTEAVAGYTLGNGGRVNEIAPINFLLSNKSTKLPLSNTEVKLAAVKEWTDDTDYFDLSYDFDTIAKGGTTAGRKTVTVSPKDAKTCIARPEAYKVDLVMTADELPEGGVLLAHLTFKVNPGFIVSVNGVKAELKAAGNYQYRNTVNGEAVGEPITVPQYTFEMGAYNANSDITNGIRLDVSSADGKRVMFKSEEAGGAKNADLPTGLALGAALDSTMNISGYLAPETWTLEENAVGNAVYAYDNKTGECVYQVPFLVADVIGNEICYVGLLRVKPAELVITGAEEKAANNYAVEITGTVGYKQIDKMQTLTITNPGCKDMVIWAVAPDATKFQYVTTKDVEGVETVEAVALTGGKVKLSIKAGETIELSIAPKAGLVTGEEASKITDTVYFYAVADVNGTTVGTSPDYGNKINKIVTKTINLTFKLYKADTLVIISPEGDVAGRSGSDSTAENIRVLNIGIGEKVNYVFKAEGTEKPITWSLAPATAVVLQDGQEYRCTSDELASDGYNLKFANGVLSSMTGPTSQGRFVICVKAVSHKNGGLDTVDNEISKEAYYLINVGKTDKAITVSDEKEKVLKAEDGDTTAYNTNTTVEYVKSMSETRNLLMETNRDSINPVKATITIKNDATIPMTDVKVTFGAAKKLDGGVEALQGRKNPFEIPELTDGYNILVGSISENGGTASFDIEVKALHFNAQAGVVFPEGKYLLPVTISGTEMVNKIFYVILNVTKTPVIQGVNIDPATLAAYTDATINGDYHNAAQFNEVKAELNRDVAANLGADFTADLGNTIIGNKVAIGQPLNVQLTTKDVNNTNKLDNKKVQYHWFKTLPSDPEIPSTIKLSDDGLITGTPSAAGTYYITVMAEDISDEDNVTVGYKDICIYIPGNARVAVTIDDKSVNDATAAEYLYFKGAVKGSVIDDTYTKQFVIKNREADKPVTGLNVEFRDSADSSSFAGSAAHFKAELSATTIASGVDKTVALKITPQGTATPGVYKAIAVITSDQISPVEFPVVWVVTDELVASRPGLDETTGRTGQKTIGGGHDKDYKVTFTATGAGIYYNAADVLQENDIDWYKTMTGTKNAKAKELMPDSATDALVLKQAVTWYIKAKDDDLDDSKLIALVKALNEMGFNNGAWFDETDADIKKDIKDHKISIAATINNSTINSLTSTDLTGGGTYTFTIAASVEAVKSENLETVILPAQESEVEVTLTIIPTNDVYVLKEVDNRYGISNEEVVSTHKSIVGEQRDIAEYKKVSEFAFRDVAKDDAAELGNLEHTFTVKNEIDSDLWISAKIVDSLSDNAAISTAFTITKSNDEDYAGAKVKLGRCVQGQDNAPWIQGTRTFKVKVDPTLGVGEYSAYLIIEGSGIETIKIHLTASISEPEYIVAVQGKLTKADPDADAALEDMSFTLKPAKKGAEAGLPLGYLDVYAVGNKSLQIKRVAELKDGVELGAGAETKLKWTFTNTAGVIKGQNVTMIPAANVAVPSVITDDHAEIALQPSDKDAVSDNSVVIRIWYTDANAEVGQSYVDVTVNYVVYDDANAVTVSPNQAEPAIILGGAAVSEGYDVAENSQVFTLKVAEGGDKTNALYNLKVTVDTPDVFKIKSDSMNGDVAGAVCVMPGEELSFKLEPLDNLPAGVYEPVVSFTGANMKTITRSCKFTVTKSTEFSSYISDGGWTLLGGFKVRVNNTLAALDAQNGADFHIEHVGEGEGLAATKANFDVNGYLIINGNDNDLDTTNDSLNGGYIIDLNDNGRTPDVAVYEYQGILTFTKLRTYNQPKYTTTITNNHYVAGAEEFNKISFKALETVDFQITNDDYELTLARKGGVIIDGVDMGAIDDPTSEFVKKYGEAGHTFHFLVPYKQKLNTAIEMESYKKHDYSEPYMEISCYTEGKTFEGFMNGKLNFVKAETVIIEDMLAFVKWHDHLYAQIEDSMTYVGDGEGVEWVWEGSVEEGFTGAKVHLTCVDPNGCPDADKGLKELTAIVTPVKDKGSCTQGGHMDYSAVAVFDQDAGIGYNDVSYVSENKALFEGKVDRHVYTYDWNPSQIVWYNTDDINTVYATVVKTCVSELHKVSEDGDYSVVVSSNRVEFYGEAPTCDKEGSGYYHAIFEDKDIPEADIEAGKNIVSQNAPVVKKLGHKWQIVSSNWVGSYADGVSQVVFSLVCENDPEHVSELTVASANINAIYEDDNVKTFRAIGELDDCVLVEEKDFYSHTEHDWSVSWNWITHTNENAEVMAYFTCKVGGEEQKVSATMTKEMDTIAVTWTATVEFDGKTWTDVKSFDLETGEEIVHTHDWTTEPVWTWNAVDQLTDTTAFATFFCKTGGETKKVDATIKEEKRTKRAVIYLATVTGPDGKEYTDKITRKLSDQGGENEIPTVEGGDIVIVGLEETYEFTGAKLKPVIKVVDETRGVTLANTTDYSISYTGKNKIGEVNTVEVKGKGNYSGKSAVAKFTITDPRADIDPEKLAGPVKKVEVSDKKFVFDGTAKYPATVTVTLKDNSTIVYNFDGIDDYTTESEKEVGISICNNFNKGTANVAAMGSDGKVKKASFKIEAAEISGANFTIEEVTWGTKAETALVTATFGEEEYPLVAGQDFKVTFKAAAAGDTAGVAKISGKGNFKGKHADVAYKVNALELTEENIIVDAVAGKKVKNVKVQVVDNAGNALGKKLYSYTVQDAEGNALDKNAALPEEIKVVVKASGNAVTDEDGVAVDVTTGSQLSKAAKFKVDKNFNKTFTGEAITLTEEDFAAGKIDCGTLKLGDDFKIVAYKNNVKKGSMTVTVQGIGTYSGTKSFKVKIVGKPVDKIVNE